MKTEYVCGFVFKQLRHGPHVILIRKNKPEWQRGKLNGVGGKIDAFETAPEAMCREFFEETGLAALGWTKFAHLEFQDSIVHFYQTTVDPLWDFSKSPEAEKIEEWDVNELLNGTAGRPGGRATDLIPNLKWLIPLALAGEPMIQYVKAND